MYDQQEHSPTERGRRRLLALGGRSVLSLAALAAIGAVGVFGTQAAFTDDVTMAEISVTGGSLDMVANADADDTNVAWSGGLSVALTGIKPGDVNSGTVEIENTGDLPFTMTASTSGTDASGCFGYYLRETSVTGGSGASSFPVNFTGFGTGSAADGTAAAFGTAVANRQLPDSGADLEWEPGDAKVYTLTMRMLSSCTTNGAAATMDVSFDADQV